jgi:hypothetical protein
MKFHPDKYKCTVLRVTIEQKENNWCQIPTPRAYARVGYLRQIYENVMKISGFIWNI